MSFPPSPGPGTYVLTLDTAPFFILVGLLAVFAAMLWLLRNQYPGRRRGLDGYLEAAGVDLAFLAFAVVLVVSLCQSYPHGNRTSFALYRVVLDGYWLTFAIPVVAVGSSVHSRSRGGIPWLVPSVAAALLLFVALFAYYYSAG
ncbi:MAG: hypothetical protein ACHQ2Y_07730 [Candidatus Lutacidiplasmatales archaeon]